MSTYFLYHCKESQGNVPLSLASVKSSDGAKDPTAWHEEDETNLEDTNPFCSGKTG